MANKRKNENKKSTETEPIQEETLQTVLVQVDASNTETASDVLQVSGEHADVTEEAGTQELFSTQIETEPGVGDWAESGASCDPPQSPTPPDMFSEGDETPVPIPEELVYLRNTGAHFSHVPSTCWKLNQSSARLYKDRSVYFSVDTVCTSHDILFGFDKAGIDIDTITSIQRRNSNRSWVVSFGTFEEKECALEVGGVTVCGLEVFLGDAQFRTVLVKIYEYPNEMPDTAVIGRLSKYGHVLSFRRDKIVDVLYNRVRTARMRLMNHIPCSIHVVGEPIIVYYESQPRTCRRCGDTDHVAQNCCTPRCYNCDAPGHRGEHCLEKLLCAACFSADHETSVCPFILYSGNVELPVADSDAPKTYAAAAVSTPAVAHAPRQDQRQTQQKSGQAASAKGPDPVKETAQKGAGKKEQSSRDDNNSRKRKRDDDS